MERKIRIKSKSREEAIKNAINHFNVLENDLDIIEIEPPSKGFLGFIGSKDGTYDISVIIREIDVARDFLEKIINNLKIDVNLNISQEDKILKVDITGKDASVLIGKRGETLDSIQLLTGLALNKFRKDSELRVLIDVENYREKREESLKNYARKVSNQVIKYKKTKKLEYMNPYERRIIHSYLQSNKKINTYSEGNDPYRRLVIEYVEPSV